MGGLCGYVGSAPPGVLEAMSGAIPHLGATMDSTTGDGFGLAIRHPDTATNAGLVRDARGVTCFLGELWPTHEGPGARVKDLLSRGGSDLGAAMSGTDGAFAFAIWNAEARRMMLGLDPFGMRSLCWTRVGEAFYFASEIKQLASIPGFVATLDAAAIHKYLAFSFVPGEDTPLAGVRRLLPGRIGIVDATSRVPAVERWFTLPEAGDPKLADAGVATRRARRLVREAVEKRLGAVSKAGLFLSGGLDSSIIGFFLKKCGIDTRAFSLDLGERGAEKAEAAAMAKHLDLPLEWVPIDLRGLADDLDELAWVLDLPFGDPVTGPQLALGRAAKAAGYGVVFNGEGGDQLFGGWTNKPMVAAAAYAGLYDEETPEETYLRSYHRFYGLEAALYAPDFAAAVGGPGQRRAHLRPYLSEDAAESYLNRLRLADVHLKGSQNILPRAGRTARACGLNLRMPLFDRALAEMAFALPPEMKLHGATEKWVLKAAMQGRLPHDLLWRGKVGMSVPITEWVLGPLADVVEAAIGPDAIANRGLFRSPYVERLRRGEDHGAETRRRRVGERLWTLVMLEAWMRVFLDGKGRRPGTRGTP